MPVFTCLECGHVCGTKRGIRQHHTQAHTTRFQCQTCHKTFKSQNALTQHEALHSGEKKFVCTGCSTGFTEKGNLTKHMKSCNRVHSTPVKEFECGHCSYQCTEPCSLWKHLGYHASCPRSTPCAKLPSEEKFGFKLVPQKTKIYHKTHPLHGRLAAATSNDDTPTMVCPLCEEGIHDGEDWEYCPGPCCWPFHSACVEKHKEETNNPGFLCRKCVLLVQYEMHARRLRAAPRIRTLLLVCRKQLSHGVCMFFILLILDSNTSLVSGLTYTLRIDYSTLRNVHCGLFIKGNCKRGDLVDYIRGDELTLDTARRTISPWLFALPDGQWMVGNIPGKTCIGRYANHHLALRNAETRLFVDMTGERMLAIYALRDLENEEVFIDYSWIPDRDKKVYPWYYKSTPRLKRKFWKTIYSD
ncbi:hypothetical protein RCL1_007468 [Eukaryota sp. TZLM3-RCL]